MDTSKPQLPIEQSPTTQPTPQIETPQLVHPTAVSPLPIGILRKPKFMVISFLLLIVVMVLSYFFFHSAPKVNLLKPENQIILREKTVDLNFIVEKSYLFTNVKSCALYLNGVFHEEIKDVPKNTALTFHLNNLLNKKYNWEITCTDNLFNFGKTSIPEKREFFVIIPLEIDSIESALLNFGIGDGIAFHSGASKNSPGQIAGIIENGEYRRPLSFSGPIGILAMNGAESNSIDLNTRICKSSNCFNLKITIPSGPGNLWYYIDEAGSTYYARKDHQGGMSDLDPLETLRPEHLARSALPCEVDCGSNAYCSYNQCLCNYGYTECGDNCVNLTTDVANCGSCSKRCQGEEICVQGVCKQKPKIALSGTPLKFKDIKNIEFDQSKRLGGSVGIFYDTETSYNIRTGRVGWVSKTGFRDGDEYNPEREVIMFICVYDQADAQVIAVTTENGKYDIKIPAINKQYETLLLYVDSNGLTFHSNSAHTYPDGCSKYDLSPYGAFKIEHLASEIP